MIIVAHRGAHEPETPGVRENTLEAFRAAADLGIDGVELDVRATADGILVVHHDAVLPDGRAIGALTVDGRPAWLPTLAEVLDACAPLALVNVEIKASPIDPAYRPVDEEQAVRAIAAAGGASRHAVSSFNLATLDAVHATAPDLPTAWLTMSRYDQADAVATAAGAGHRAINPPDSATTAELVEVAHAAGLQIMVWTVNDPDRMTELAGWGVDVLITDTPALARSVLG